MLALEPEKMALVKALLKALLKESSVLLWVMRMVLLLAVRMVKKMAHSPAEPAFHHILNYKPKSKRS